MLLYYNVSYSTQFLSLTLAKGSDPYLRSFLDQEKISSHISNTTLVPQK
jgi:hypothetical protein